MTKVLLVEDDKSVSMALAYRMRALRYQVVTAADAVYAMTKAVDCKPDVVVLDINLPGGDGVMVAERMLQDSETSNIPVIFITASKKSTLRERANKLNPVAFLEKPFSSQELIDAIELSMESTYDHVVSI